jgi:hypothetical protein
MFAANWARRLMTCTVNFTNKHLAPVVDAIKSGFVMKFDMATANVTQEFTATRISYLSMTNKFVFAVAPKFVSDIDGWRR